MKCEALKLLATLEDDIKQLEIDLAYKATRGRPQNRRSKPPSGPTSRSGAISTFFFGPSLLVASARGLIVAEVERALFAAAW